MNQEEMANELERVLEILKTLDPTSKEYTEANRNYHELLKAFHEELSACDADLDHRLKRELDKAEQTRREKETEEKVELDKIRQQLNEREAADRLKMAKFDAIIGLAKIGLTVSGTLAAIVLTGTLEESTILSAKCLSWIKGIAPRV